MTYLLIALSITSDEIRLSGKDYLANYVEDYFKRRNRVSGWDYKWTDVSVTLITWPVYIM